MTAKLESFSFCDKKYFYSFPWKANIGCENISWKFHMNVLPSFFFLLDSFEGGLVTGWVTVIHVSKPPFERYLCYLGKKSPITEPLECIQDNKTFSRPVLPWAITMKHVESQSIQDTAVITLSNTFCSKHLQVLSSPALLPLCSPFQAFCPHLDNSSSSSLLCTCFFTQLSSSTFAEASWIVAFSPLLKGSCDQRCIPDPICEVGFFAILEISPSVRSGFSRSSLQCLWANPAYLCSSKRTDTTE